MTDDRYDVLIAGAGPTGLVLALWLTRLGVRVRIIDKVADEICKRNLQAPACLVLVPVFLGGFERRFQIGLVMHERRREASGK